MKGRTILAIVGCGLIGLGVLTFILHALLQLSTGDEWGYRNYKGQPMTYLGALATLGIGALVGVVGLYYRVKRMIQSRRDGAR